MGRDFPPVQNDPGAHPASRTMGTGSFTVKIGRGVTLTAHPLLVRRSWKSRAIPLPTLWVTSGPVTGTLDLYLYYDLMGPPLYEYMRSCSAVAFAVRISKQTTVFPLICSSLNTITEPEDSSRMILENVTM